VVAGDNLIGHWHQHISLRLERSIRCGADGALRLAPNHAGRTHDDRRRRAGNALDASTLALWAARSFSDLSAVCVRVLLWSLALRSVLWSGLDRDRAADYPPDRKYFRFGKNGNDVRVDNGDPSARRGFRRPCSAASCASAKKAGESVDARTMLRSPGGGVG
jgi:hypothetical protein